MGRTFIIEYADNGDAELRATHRAAHIEYRKGLGNRLMLAGPLLDESDVAIGSLILLEAADRQDAEAVATADPMVKAGVLTVRSIRSYRVAHILDTRP